MRKRSSARYSSIKHGLNAKSFWAFEFFESKKIFSSDSVAKHILKNIAKYLQKRSEV